MLGQRVYDLMRTLDLLASLGGRDLHLTGEGMGGIVAAIVGGLHPAVGRVTLKRVPRSFHEMTQVPIQRRPLSISPLNGLPYFDLPDCYRVLRQNRNLRIIEPWDAGMQPDWEGSSRS